MNNCSFHDEEKRRGKKRADSLLEMRERVRTSRRQIAPVCGDRCRNSGESRVLQFVNDFIRVRVACPRLSRRVVPRIVSRYEPGVPARCICTEICNIYFGARACTRAFRGPRRRNVRTEIKIGTTRGYRG